MADTVKARTEWIQYAYAAGMNQIHYLSALLDAGVGKRAALIQAGIRKLSDDDLTHLQLAEGKFVYPAGYQVWHQLRNIVQRRYGYNDSGTDPDWWAEYLNEAVLAEARENMESTFDDAYRAAHAAAADV